MERKTSRHIAFLGGVSYEGEIPFDNYLRIDNSEKEPAEVARLIKETFGL